MPADDQEIALPCGSVMVTMVLLKVAATCATPTTTFFFSFLRARGALPPAFLSSAMTYLVTFFLPAIALAGPLRVRALVCVRWPRTGRARRGRKPREQPRAMRPLKFIPPFR